MSQKLPLDGIKWVEEASQLNEDFMKRYNEDNDIGYFIETDVQYSRKLYELHNGLPFLPKRRKTEKVEKLVASLYDENEYVVHIRNLES